MHGKYKDKPIEKAAKKNGLQVYRHPWDFGVAPDAVNEEGSEFYILYDLSDYLRRDRMTHALIPAISSAWVIRVPDLLPRLKYVGFSPTATSPVPF